MKVLFIYGGNRKPMPYIVEQKQSLVDIGLDVDEFKIVGKGIFGYLKNISLLKKKISGCHYDLIHAHYSFSALVAILSTNLPVVTTYHGSDVNFKLNRIISFIVSRLSSYNIIVNDSMSKLLRLKSKYEVIPCGVDLTAFRPMLQVDCKDTIGLSHDKYYILFSSSFNNPVKNAPLAQEIVALLNNSKLPKQVELVELKDKSREEVNLFLNACDLLLMTSFSEGSPQIVKEALATSTPVVSTNVGDVETLLNGVEPSFVTTFDKYDIAEKCTEVLNSEYRTNGSNIKHHYDIINVAEKIEKIYRYQDKRISDDSNYS